MTSASSQPSRTAMLATLNSNLNTDHKFRLSDSDMRGTGRKPLLIVDLENKRYYTTPRDCRVVTFRPADSILTLKTHKNPIPLQKGCWVAGRFPCQHITADDTVLDTVLNTLHNQGFIPRNLWEIADQ
jgi:hypothetical protein